MRFNVGDQVFGVHFSIKGTQAAFSGIFRMPFLYNPDEEIEKITVIPMTVTEHHAVACSHDPNGQKDYNGFILKGDDNKLWGNQYPSAHYEQVSDYADRVFNRIEADYKQLVANQEVIRCYLLTDFYRNAMEGAQNLAERDDDQAKKLVSKLKALLEQLDQLMLEKYKLKFYSKPIWAEHPDILKYYLDNPEVHDTVAALEKQGEQK